jgi:glutathione peroxidase
MANAHDFSFPGIDGGEIRLKDFAGKPVLVVNTASACGLTPQYAGLEALWKKYGDQGLVVLGVPANDFGAQEPGTEAEIKTFCETRFAVDFPMAAKQAVIGGGAHPFYAWAAAELGEAGTPKWNFHKYLIAPDGTLAASFGSRTAPEAPEVVEAIEAALAAPTA